MRLFEFTDPIVTQLVALTDQLKTDIDSQKLPSEIPVDRLLDYFRKYNLPLDVNDLYDMIKKPPLKNLIANIQGGQVIFKGHQEPESTEDEDAKIVKQMAKSAMK